MYVVIFRAKTQALDAEYSAMAGQLRQMALDHYGCLDFTAVAENGSEIALSYWPDEVGRLSDLRLICCASRRNSPYLPIFSLHSPAMRLENR